MSDRETRMIRGITKKIMRICRSMEKAKGITELEKNSIRSTERVLQSTLQITDTKIMKSNLVLSMRTLMETGIATKNSKEFMKHHMLILTFSPEEVEREKTIQQLKAKITTSDKDMQSQGFMELRNFMREKGNLVGESFADQALESIESRDRALAIHSSMYLLELISRNEPTFDEHRDRIMQGLNSAYPEVRVLTSMMCSRAKKIDSIEDLLSLCEDQNEVNVNELEIPTHSSKFHVDHGMAKVRDVVNDCIFNIIDSTGDSSNYIALSVVWSITGPKREGEEFVITLKVKPVVHFNNLTFNLSKLNPVFDLQGRTSIILEELQQGSIKEAYIRAIPKASGHLRGSMSVTTDEGLIYELIIEDFFEKKIERHAAETEASVSSERNHDMKTTDQIQLIVRDIRTMETKNVINALDQLKSYAAGDETYENRIAAMSVNLSLKGTHRITKSEMDSILEMVDHIKNDQTK